jgi:hypothetical protein
MMGFSEIYPEDILEGLTNEKLLSVITKLKSTVNNLISSLATRDRNYPKDNSQRGTEKQNSLKDKIHKLQKPKTYSGESESCDEFVNSIGNYFALRSYSNLERIIISRSFMDKYAGEWTDSFILNSKGAMKLINGFEIFLTDFKKELKDSASNAVNLSKIKNLKMHGDYFLYK